MKTPEEFLESNGFVSRGLDRAALIAAFHHEMDAGLAGKPSSLMMIPSYVTPFAAIPHNVPAAVLDAGGTNFRGATVTILDEPAADGSPAALAHKERVDMPGVQTEVGADEFYSAFAKQVRRVMPLAKCPALGFCFSYPAEASPLGDARLIRWTKQIKAPEIVGQWVGSELAKRLDPKPKKIVVLNDTVATLLAGKATEKASRPYSAYIGFILGTGTNTAYVEQNKNITKVPGLDAAGSQIINSESGGFSRIEQSAFDAAMDKKTADCGSSRFEKMIAGVYLGRIGLEIFRAAAKAGFFSAKAAAGVRALGALESMDLDNFCAAHNTDRVNPLSAVFAAADDAALARRLVTPVFERAAILTAIHLAAFIVKTGGGTDPERPVCVNVDGSTFYKTRTVNFPKIVQAELAAMLAPRNIAFALTKVDDAPMIGAGVAALMEA